MNEETDIEALQAQIDLSNSVAFDIVSSWMKPSTSDSKSVPLRTTTRDLEGFAHRPPRLGLGATVSKTTIRTAQEAAKLKGKLTKKPNEITDDSKNRKNDDDGDEEESRNTVITQRRTTVGSSKRVIDVFSFSNKKRKRSNSHSDVLRTLDKVDSTGNANDPPTTTTLLAPAHISPLSKKRKDKGKNKQEDNINALSSTNPHVFDEEWTGFSEEVLEGIYDGVVPDGPPSTPSPPRSSSKSHSPRRGPSLSPISRPTLFRGFSVDAQRISLLNLQGPPPPSIEEGDKSSTVSSDKKKKRRRKRKKRKSDQAQGSGDIA